MTGNRTPLTPIQILLQAVLPVMVCLQMAESVDQKLFSSERVCSARSMIDLMNRRYFSFCPLPSGFRYVQNYSNHVKMQ